MSRYDDIIDHPHYRSVKRPHMSTTDRAAQFSPFAALTGYDDAVEEAARLTSGRIELDESEKEVINERLSFIRDSLPDSPPVDITYYVQDERKSGGAYITATGRVQRIDPVTRAVRMDDGHIIPIDDIFGIEGVGMVLSI